jgi:cytoskeletal protein RodZ
MPEEGRTLHELGTYLRSRREEKGITTKDVASKLHIRERYIVAIEEGDMEEFPALVYARGFIRNYLAFLKEPELWEEYSRVFPRKDEDEEPSVHSLSSAPKGFRRVAVGWLYIVLFLFVAGGGFFAWMQRDMIFEALHRDPKPTPAERVASGEVSSPFPAELPEAASSEETAAAPVEVAIVPTQVPSPAPTVAPEKPAAPSVEGDAQVALIPLPTQAQEAARKDYPWLYEAGNASAEESGEESRELVLSASGACWVRVAQGNTVLFVGTLKKGESRTFPLNKSLAVRLGNAGAVSVRWFGKTKESLGKTGEVKTLIFDSQGGMRDS